MRSPVVSLCLAIPLAACASPRTLPLPPSRPAPEAARAAPPAVEEPAGPLTLREALALALLRSPALDAAHHEERAAEARRLQAGVLPNPELAAALENTGGSLGGESETTVVLSQLVELGGKRAARVAAATAGEALAAWDREAARLDLLAGTARDFAAVLAAQARVAVAEEVLAIAGSAVEVARRRLDAGAVGPSEVSRAELEAETQALERSRAAADLAGARARLAARWGSAEARFTEAAGEPPPAGAPPGVAALAALLAGSPDLARFAAEIAVAEARVDAARADRVPDLTVAAGRRRFAGSGDHAYLFEVSAPIPLFDRRSGDVAAAEAALAAVHARRAETAARLRAELVAARAVLEAAAGEEAALRARILPRAREVLDATAERYAAGRVGLLEMLDARRTFAEVAARESAVRAEALALRIEIERLVAGPLHVPPRAPGSTEE